MLYIPLIVHIRRKERKRRVRVTPNIDMRIIRAYDKREKRGEDEAKRLNQKIDRSWV